MAEPAVGVVVQIDGEDVLAGRLWAHRRRQAESATFVYDAQYLLRAGAYALDPALGLVAGQQQTRDGRAIFGAFSDCAPDRWGRRLIARAERQRVGREGGGERSFAEIEYLLGVRDDLRQGALRFRDFDADDARSGGRRARKLLEIADVIERCSPQIGDDLRGLWRRIAFSILISNTDDHLRNHGFLRTSCAGWALSPAFDLDPDPRPGPKHLSTAIDFDDTTASVDLLMSVAGNFRLGDAEARRILREVRDASSLWQSVARRKGLSRAAIDQMAPSFEHEEARRAAQVIGDG